VLLTAQIRSTPADFIVTEDLSPEFTDEGEHDFLWIEKTGANTHWVAERLAEHARVPARDVGYAGLKDRHAITGQWFSVRRTTGAGCSWDEFAAEGVTILETRRHQRKLRRGAHRGNRFRIAMRADDVAASADRIEKRLSLIAADGVPNYFGEQRFGREGRNIALCRALFAGRRMSRNQRSMALSAARAWLFNDILDDRVRAGTWNKILPGELANLDGSGSVFAVDEVTPELERRCIAQDIHPSATLWGTNAPRTTGDLALLEQRIAARHADLADGLNAAKVEASTRPLRLRVTDLQWEIEKDVIWLQFHLVRGSFATAVLREIADASAAPR
jgi:tRNA pseudouridine13 synthase